jgi:hypothetical protein
MFLADNLREITRSESVRERGRVRHVRRVGSGLVVREKVYHAGFIEPDRPGRKPLALSAKP